MYTTEHLPSCTANWLDRSVKKVVNVYRRGGFVVQLILMDGEFEKVREEMPDVEMNTAAAHEHVTDIER